MALEMVCKSCGEKMPLDDTVSLGQPVRCEACGTKNVSPIDFSSRGETDRMAKAVVKKIEESGQLKKGQTARTPAPTPAPTNGSKTWTPVTILLSLLITIAVSLSSFALAFIFDANATAQVQQERIEALDKKIDERMEWISQQIQAAHDDQAEVEKLQKTASKHWKLHGWSREQINTLRHEAGQPPASWPDLGD